MFRNKSNATTATKNTITFAIGIACISLLMMIDGIGTYFQAYVDIHILWNTGTAMQLMGYNLYRSNDIDGTYIRVNASMIPIPDDLFLSTEIAYSDRAEIPVDNNYYYKIEEIYLTGSRMQEEPIQIDVRRVVGSGVIIGFIILWLVIFQIRSAIN